MIFTIKKSCRKLYMNHRANAQSNAVKTFSSLTKSIFAKNTGPQFTFSCSANKDLEPILDCSDLHI